jgi:hypothetical protein
MIGEGNEGELLSTAVHEMTEGYIETNGANRGQLAPKFVGQIAIFLYTSIENPNVQKRKLLSA